MIGDGTDQGIYEAMRAAGVPMDHHESDLYVPVNETTRGIVARYYYKDNVTTFTSQVDGQLWFDIPFAFTPWWDRRVGKGRAGQSTLPAILVAMLVAAGIVAVSQWGVGEVTAFLVQKGW